MCTLSKEKVLLNYLRHGKEWEGESVFFTIPSFHQDRTFGASTVTKGSEITAGSGPCPGRHQAPPAPARHGQHTPPPFETL